MRPGPLLGTIVDTVTGEDGSGLPGCSGDQLMGVISGTRRQRSGQTAAPRASWP